jgi:hypothetical protein
VIIIKYQKDLKDVSETIFVLIQGPFVDGAAVYIPKEGIILCGGLVGTRANHSSTNKCYFMDHTRTIAESKQHS